MCGRAPHRWKGSPKVGGSPQVGGLPESGVNTFQSLDPSSQVTQGLPCLVKAPHEELRVPPLGGGPGHTSSQQVDCILLACVNRWCAICRRAAVDCGFYCVSPEGQCCGQTTYRKRC